MTNEEKLRETFPNTIFIFRKNSDDLTTAIMCSDEWLQGDYDQMYKDSAPCEDVVDAINELFRHKQEVQNDFGWNITLQDALDMAIEALKAELCGDCDKWETDKTACQKCGEPCKDAVSRDSLLENVRAVKIDGKYQHVIYWNDIKTLPPVIPKPLDSVLDEIRTEIESCLKALDEIEKSGFNIYLPNEMSGRKLTYKQCLGFIDKYKDGSDIKKRKECPHKPCINYEDGCEEWAGCPCVHYKAKSEG